VPKLKPGTIWPTPEEDAAITAAAMSDPEPTKDWVTIKHAMPLLALTWPGACSTWFTLKSRNRTFASFSRAALNPRRNLTMLSGRLKNG